jgi:hypothetical protein
MDFYHLYTYKRIGIVVVRKQVIVKSRKSRVYFFIHTRKILYNDHVEVKDYTVRTTSVNVFS